MSVNYSIDADFPGGNIIIDDWTETDAHIHQDLRDTRGDWFYWCFRVKGMAGRELRFHFTGSNVIGVRGPAVSSDRGRHWRWLGMENVREKTFSYAFDAGENEVRFSFGMPYQASRLHSFLSGQREQEYLEPGTLCSTRKGRTVEKLRAGCIHAQPRHRVLITCRHHACEMMANYTLEGIIEGILEKSVSCRRACVK